MSSFKMSLNQIVFSVVAFAMLVCAVSAHLDDDHHHHDVGADHGLHKGLPEDDLNDEKKDKADVPTAEEIDYHKGSLCGYCTYCKFCKLCDDDCPCEKSATKPNCHMCKYCKFCYMCKVCDTICQPGGMIDRVTASIFSALPRYDTNEIDKDIDGVSKWIDKDEL